MRALILGGTGFIGRSLVRAALSRGWEVTLMVRRPESPAARQLSAEGAGLVLGDITDRASLRTAIEVARPDLLFHNAGWYELGIPRRRRRETWAVNVEGTENALGLAAEAGIPRVVYTSSTTAMGDTAGEVVDESFTRRSEPLSVYERSKTEAHAVARRHQAGGEPVIIACPAQVIGPGDHSSFGHLARWFVRGLLPPIAWAPEGAFTFVHVEDVAEALLVAGEQGRPGEVYFLAGSVMTNRELMRVWGEATGRRPPFLWLPRGLALAQAAVLGSVLSALGRPAFICPEAVRSSYVSFRYRSEKAERELGVSFRPAAQAWAETLRAEMDSRRRG